MVSERFATAAAEDEEGVAFVFAPTRPYEPAAMPDAQAVQFELRSLDDGSAALPVFTDQEQLVAQLGAYQPWVKISVLDLLVQVSAAKVQVVVDPVLQANVERWTEADLKAWRGGAA